VLRIAGEHRSARIAGERHSRCFALTADPDPPQYTIVAPNKSPQPTRSIRVVSWRLSKIRTPANPIAVEVARLIDGYTSNFRAHVRRRGRIPPDILRVKPRWPIEAVAMRLTTQAIRETLAQARSSLPL